MSNKTPIRVSGSFTPSGTQDVNIVGTIPIPVTDNGGSLTIDGSVSVLNFPATQSVTQGTTPWIVDGSGFTQPISGTITALQGTSPWIVDGSGFIQPISGTIAISQVGTDNNVDANIINASIAVTGPLTDAELRASPVPVTIPTPVPVTDNGGSLTVDGTVSATQGTSPWVISGTVTATPVGTQDVNLVQLKGIAVSSGSGTTDAATQRVVLPTDQTAIPVTDNGGSITVDGTVTSNQGTANSIANAWPIKITDGTDTADVTAASALKVDGSAVIQPISGTVTANQGTSPWVENVSQFGGSNVVTGTGTSGAGIPRVTISNDSSLAANQSVNVNQIGGSAITLGQKTMANSTPVVIASDQTSIPFERVATSAVTRVASNSAVSQTLLASNTNRKQTIFYNDSTGVQYLKFGTTASTTDFTVRMTSQSYYELPLPVYTGRIDSISGNNNGAIQVTELTV